jgi:hypothetical protein
MLSGNVLHRTLAAFPGIDADDQARDKKSGNRDLDKSG